MLKIIIYWHKCSKSEKRKNCIFTVFAIICWLSGIEAVSDLALLRIKCNLSRDSLSLLFKDVWGCQPSLQVKATRFNWNIFQLTLVYFLVRRFVFQLIGDLYIDRVHIFHGSNQFPMLFVIECGSKSNFINYKSQMSLD